MKVTSLVNILVRLVTTQNKRINRNIIDADYIITLFEGEFHRENIINI